jgi:hypothetical protein
VSLSVELGTCTDFTVFWISCCGWCCCTGVQKLSNLQCLGLLVLHVFTQHSCKGHLTGPNRKQRFHDFSVTVCPTLNSSSLLAWWIDAAEKCLGYHCLTVAVSFGFHVTKFYPEMGSTLWNFTATLVTGKNIIQHYTDSSKGPKTIFLCVKQF